MKNVLSCIISITMTAGICLQSYLFELDLIQIENISAETALDNNVEGDLNADGHIDTTDLTAISLYLLGDMKLSEVQQNLADFDCDGEVSLADLAKLRQFLAKKIPQLADLKDNTNFENIEAESDDEANKEKLYLSENIEGQPSERSAQYYDNSYVSTTGELKFDVLTSNAEMLTMPVNEGETIKVYANARGYWPCLWGEDDNENRVNISDKTIFTNDKITIPKGIVKVYLFNIKTRSDKIELELTSNSDDKTVESNTRVIVDVNGNGDFTDIQSAIDYLSDNFNVAEIPTTVFIRNGVYNIASGGEKNWAIYKGANKISIIGESREGVILKYNATPAVNHKVIEFGGEATLANLTILNLFNDDGSVPCYDHNPYCVHNDSWFAVNYKYNTVIENCYFYSEVFNPVGAGLRSNQNQIYRNCVFEFNPKDSRLDANGALYVHAPAWPAEVDCSIEVDNCTCISRGYATGLYLNNVKGSLSYIDIPVTVRRTIAISELGEATNVSKETHKLTIDSALNNVSSLNY